MIQVTAQMRILLAIEPVDFRGGIDALGRVCREALGSDPFSGTVFVFRNRSGTGLRVLSYDGQGFWLCYKRLSAGRIRWWPRSAQSGALALEAAALQVLLWNGDPSVTRTAPLWRRLAMRG